MPACERDKFAMNTLISQIEPDVALSLQQIVKNTIYLNTLNMFIFLGLNYYECLHDKHFRRLLISKLSVL